MRKRAGNPRTTSRWKLLLRVLTLTGVLATASLLLEYSWRPDESVVTRYVLNSVHSQYLLAQPGGSSQSDDGLGFQLEAPIHHEAALHADTEDTQHKAAAENAQQNVTAENAHSKTFPDESLSSHADEEAEQQQQEAPKMSELDADAVVAEDQEFSGNSTATGSESKDSINEHASREQAETKTKSDGKESKKGNQNTADVLPQDSDRADADTANSAENDEQHAIEDGEEELEEEERDELEDEDQAIELRDPKSSIDADEEDVGEKDDGQSKGSKQVSDANKKDSKKESEPKPDSDSKNDGSKQDSSDHSEANKSQKEGSDKQDAEKKQGTSDDQGKGQKDSTNGNETDSKESRDLAESSAEKQRDSNTSLEDKVQEQELEGQPQRDLSGADSKRQQGPESTAGNKGNGSAEASDQTTSNIQPSTWGSAFQKLLETSRWRKNVKLNADSFPLLNSH